MTGETTRDVPLRVGQIGVGQFGATRRRMLRETGLYKLIALADWDAGTLSRAAGEDNAHACGSYEELLDTPGLEAVIICTGAKYHAEQVVAALKHGLPVFVEKPLCATAKEVQEIVSAQRETRLPVGVGHLDHRTQALSRTIKTLLETGQLGDIVAFERTTAHSGGFQIRPGDWRGDPEKNPGGMLFQCGVHAFHELMFYFGPVAEISARMRYDVHSSKTADVALCHLAFASGVIGTLCAYHVTPYRHTLSIFGTRANLYRDDRYFDEGVRLCRQQVGKDGCYEPHETVVPDGKTDDCGDIRAFYRAVRSGEMHYPSLWDGARTVAAVFAAEESAKAGRPVEVGSVGPI